MTLATVSGKIQFPANYGINASGEDYDAFVVMGDKFISVNASGLDPSFNATSNITINNVSCPAVVYFVSGFPNSQ